MPKVFEYYIRIFVHGIFGIYATWIGCMAHVTTSRCSRCSHTWIHLLENKWNVRIQTNRNELVFGMWGGGQRGCGWMCRFVRAHTVPRQMNVLINCRLRMKSYERKLHAAIVIKDQLNLFSIWKILPFVQFTRAFSITLRRKTQKRRAMKTPMKWTLSVWLCECVRLLLCMSAHFNRIRHRSLGVRTVTTHTLTRCHDAAEYTEILCTRIFVYFPFNDT